MHGPLIGTYMMYQCLSFANTCTTQLSAALMWETEENVQTLPTQKQVFCF